jgi:hypothetical protein
MSTNRNVMREKLPAKMRRLTLYDELVSYLEQFAQGLYPFLWLTGRPGVGKTEEIAKAMQGRTVWLAKSGQLTPLRLYIECYAHLDQPIILDDVEHLLDDPLGAKLVSALGDTSAEKLLNWHSSSGRLGDTPEQFRTTSPVCIIANETVTRLAIQNRALMLYFDPDNAEIHRHTASWFWDQEIHDWIGKRLARLQPLDARTYIHTYNDKAAGRDWRKLFLDANAADPIECLVQDLEIDPAYPTVKDKERRFGEVLGGKGGSRANYHNVKKRLKAAGRLIVEATLGVIPLRQTRPLVRRGDAPLYTPPADVPPGVPCTLTNAREEFVATNQRQNAQTQTQPRSAADDTVAWERPKDNDEDEQEE